MARSPKSAKRSKSKARKSANRPKRAAKRTKPASRGVRRPARSSKPQRKAKAPARRTKPTRKAARRSAKSAPRQAAARPASAKAPAAKGGRKALRVVLFGAGGMVGSRIAKEALARGHHVVAVQRNPGGLDLDGRHVMTVSGDATDPASVAELARGADIVASAVSPRNPPGANTLPRAAAALLAGTRKAGVKRLVVVGGAGSLSVGPSKRLIDSSDFPAEYRPEAQEHVDALTVFRRDGQGVDWTFVSPSAMIFPGKRTGKYQAGTDDLLVDSSGQSQISAEDYAIAFVDELERGDNKGRRMTVAWR
jgi:putative NADH-flavin reductase